MTGYLTIVSADRTIRTTYAGWTDDKKDASWQLFDTKTSNALANEYVVIVSFNSCERTDSNMCHPGKEFGPPNEGKPIVNFAGADDGLLNELWEQ